MFLKEGPVLLLKFRQSFEEPVSEEIFSVGAFGIKKIPIGQMDQLPRVYLVEIFGKIPVLLAVEGGNLSEICGDVVELRRFIEDRKGVAMHFSVKGGRLFGNETHGLEPARSGCFQVEPFSGQLAHRGKDGELVTSGMDGDLISAVILCDHGMLIELVPEFFEIADVVNSLLKFSDESGGQRFDPDPPLAQ